MPIKKFMIVTTGRADYGLLHPLIKKLSVNKNVSLQLIVTGSHLSPTHGNTVNFIENDPDIKITETVKMTGRSDREGDICRSIAKGLIGFSSVLEKHAPDMMVVLGDRYELWSACIPAVIHKIPIAHIHGGESTQGLIDDPVRHSITKTASFHFASIDPYANRIIQMGENPNHVFVVGAIGIDNIRSIPLMTSEELSRFSGVDFTKEIALMTYHPVTLDAYDNAENQITDILESVLNTGLTTLITMPNQDTSGNIIYEKINSYCDMYPEQFKFKKSLGQRAYLSAMRHAIVMIGNSSSGIIESASFHLPVVNIGDRQKGRFKPANIIDCDCSRHDIGLAVNRALSSEFKKSVSQLKSPYGDGRTAQRISDILTLVDLDNKSRLLKKGFHDLKRLPDNILERLL